MNPQQSSMNQYGLQSSQGRNLQGQGYQGNQFGVTPTVTQVTMPTQFIERPVAVHEQIRAEQVEEIQPVINVEKLYTEVIQKTQPLLDKEIRPVLIQQKVLPGQVLPELDLPNVSSRSLQDVSTVQFMNTASMVVEKPPIVNETDRTQIIEEIQPVIYKETIVPTVIRETKPIYQKVVEGTVYVQEVLPPKPLSNSGFSYQQQGLQQPMQQQAIQPPMQQQGLQQQGLQQSGLKETVSTKTTTTTNAPYQPIQNL